MINHDIDPDEMCVMTFTMKITMTTVDRFFGLPHGM